MTVCIHTGLAHTTAYRKGCRCVECVDFMGKRRKNDPAQKERARLNNLKRYGLDDATFKSMMDSCGGKCMICGQEAKFGFGHGNALHIDHDHVTGKVRGLLCGSCNVGLGHFNHDPIRLLDARIYLQESIDAAE